MKWISVASKVLLTLLCLIVFLALPLSPLLSKESKSSPASPDSDWRATPPPAGPPISVKFPHIVREVLPNGMTLLVIEDHRLPVVSYTLLLKGGSSTDPEGLEGVAAFTVEMLKEGTRSRSARVIADTVDRMGGELGGSATPDASMISLSLLKEYEKEGLTLLADLVGSPLFPEKEMEKARARLLANLMRKKAEANYLAVRAFSKVLYGAHPYSRIDFTEETLRKISRDNLVKYHGQYYSPGVSVLAVVGDVERGKILEEVRKVFMAGGQAQAAASKASGSTGAGSLPSPPSRKGMTFYLVQRPDSVQATFAVGNLALKRNHPDYVPLLVAHQILGGGASSRLFKNLREKQGYTYGVYSYLSAMRELGHWTAWTAVRNEVTEGTLTELLKELSRMTEEPVSDEELKDARSYLMGVFPLRVETAQGVARMALELELYDLPRNYWDTYLGKIQAVTKEEIMRVAKEQMRLSSLAVVVVGDGARIKGILEKFGTVVMFEEGKPVAAPGREAR